MKKTILFLCLITATVFYIACKPAGNDVDVNVTTDADTSMVMDEKSAMSLQDSVAHGGYLMTIMGCNDCHTPKRMTDHGPEPNPDLLLSGHPASEKLPPTDKKMLTSGYVLMNMGVTSFTGPWGTSFAANLTPDETGTGNWTYDNFRKAMKEGKVKGMDGGRMMLPPMPWQNFANVTEHDLQCVWKYIRSIKPVSNVVPAPLPPA